MTRIFISYSRRDEIFARKLATALDQLGADIWIDVEDIPAGMKWSTAIQQGLDTAEAMLVILSPDSMASRNVEDEWQYFLDHGKPVFPLLLRDAKIHFQLNRIQWVDFKNQPFDNALVDLHQELHRKGIALNAPQPAPAPYPPLSYAHASPQTRAPEPVASQVTSTIQAQKPDLTGSTSAGSSRMMIYGGVGVFGVIAVLILFFIFRLQNETPIAGEVTDPAPQTQVAQADDTPTQPLEPTRITPVTANDEWEPIERIIDGVPMVLVPPGQFRQGTTDAHYAYNQAVCVPKLGESSCNSQLGDEFNGSLITIEQPYWIDRYEVSEQVYGSSTESALPQVNITSAEAQAHCEARDAHLPGEIEWEYAAKGPSNWLYPWGNEWDLNTVRANICDVNCDQNWSERAYDDRYAERAPVDAFPEGLSWVGAYNMAGNVWEWTGNEYSADTTNTLRGGGWTWVQAEATTTSRASGVSARTDFYGFRCVRPYREGDLDE
ncbi:MAG: TIR domain-containing protein [Anaerolineae bacterium]